MARAMSIVRQERILNELSEDEWISKSELSIRTNIPLSTLNYMFHGRKGTKGYRYGPLARMVIMRIDGYGYLKRYIKLKKRCDGVIVHTIGYEGLTPDRFICLLKEQNVNAVSDVRLTPLSRKKGFSKGALSTMLAENGIDYIPFKELGAPKDLRTDLYESNDYDSFFNEYYKHFIQQEEYIDELISTIKEKRCCLLCFEKDWHFCHRNVIAQELEFRGASVIHIGNQ